jgi:hypothetical protein
MRGGGRVWIYQNTKVGTPNVGKLVYLQKSFAPPDTVPDPHDGTLWRYVLVGYFRDLEGFEIWECSAGPPKPQDPRLTRKVIPGPWGKMIIEPPKESETPKGPPSGKGRHINEGLAKPDDPIYSTGPIVNGRPILQPPKETGTGRVIMVGALPADYPIYRRGPMIFGRPDPPKKKND